MRRSRAVITDVLAGSEPVYGLCARVAAIEFVVAAQVIDLRSPGRLGLGTGRAYRMKITSIRLDRMRLPLDPHPPPHPPFYAAWDPVPRPHFDAADALDDEALANTPRHPTGDDIRGILMACAG
jgi:hypothetical protein